VSPTVTVTKAVAVNTFGGRTHWRRYRERGVIVVVVTVSDTLPSIPFSRGLHYHQKCHRK